MPTLDLANLKACAAAVNLSTTLLSVDIITSALQVADLDALGIESIVRAGELAGPRVWQYPALLSSQRRPSALPQVDHDFLPLERAIGAILNTDRSV